MTGRSLGVYVPMVMVVSCALAEARPLAVRTSFPVAETVLAGRNAQYVVRFDGWIDHGASQIEIIEDGKFIERLVPAADSEPDVLAASAPLLAPGHYQLHWRVKSVPDGDFSDGFISFTVTQ